MCVITVVAMKCVVRDVCNVIPSVAHAMVLDCLSALNVPMCVKTTSVCATVLRIITMTLHITSVVHVVITVIAALDLLLLTALPADTSNLSITQQSMVTIQLR